MEKFESIPEAKSGSNDARTDDGWIDEDDLPVRADLRAIQASDPDGGYTDEDIRDRNEFVRCYLLKDFEVLLMLPSPSPKADFFVTDFEESAFNTEDFYRLHAAGTICKTGYRYQKILEQVKQMALLHSCIASPDGRKRMCNRYRSLINSEFRIRALNLAEKYRTIHDPQKRSVIRDRIGELNQIIIHCRRVWERHAPRDG
jgi:hypothetical protein